jgi:hypothetical protein
MDASEFEGLEGQLKEKRNKVDVSNVSFSAREIVRMYIDDELIIAPSYQRKYRWPKNVASRFIESIFLGLPIPPIFVATNDNFSWEVVDGLQRISTLILYMADDPEVRATVSSSDALELQDLENLTQLNGKTYQDLPQPLRLYLARQPLQVVSLTDKSDKSVRFDLFERLNTGSISLSAQEVRTAVYGGSRFLSFIERLSEDENLNSLLKLQKVNQNDGTKAEQVLKFFAYKNNYEEFKGAVTKFLNSFIESMDNNISGFDYTAEERTFRETMSYLNKLMDGRPFLRNRTTVTPLVQFEAAAVGAGMLIESGVQPITPAIDWIHDDELVTASTRGSNTRSMLARRIARAKAIFSGEADVLRKP